jgi:hypothetical protein
MRRAPDWWWRWARSAPNLEASASWRVARSRTSRKRRQKRRRIYVQTPKSILIAYEYAGAARTIYMDKVPPGPADSWMGHSVGHWEGDTLVVDVTAQNDETWFDRAGDFHSDALHVTERYTPLSPDALMYETTIEDSKVFSRPWKISMPLYRRLEKNAQISEFRCVEFVEELLYGHLRKQAGK